MVTRFWEDREREKITDPIPFSIHEQDRTVIRQHIVNAVIAAPLPIRYCFLPCLIDEYIVGLMVFMCASL